MNTVTFTTVLGVTGLLLSLVGLILGPYFVWRRALAERAMVRAFAALLQRHQSQGMEQEKSAAAALQAEVDAGTMEAEAMVDLAEQATERLAEPDRILVLRALKQPSAQGRKAYVSKLIRQARMVGAG